MKTIIERRWWSTRPHGPGEFVTEEVDVVAFVPLAGTAASTGYQLHERRSTVVAVVVHPDGRYDQAPLGELRRKPA